MIVTRIFNNNVLLAQDEYSVEKMLLGKGIGFHKKVGDQVDEQTIEKIYVLEENEQVTAMLPELSPQAIIFAKQIVDHVKTELDLELPTMSYIGLADHLSYMITRGEKEESLPNALLWEIKKIYAKEFKVAKEAIGWIEAETQLSFPEDEAAFLALHFIPNQQDPTRKTQTKQQLVMIQDILQIVQVHYKMELDEASANYIRFITHLRFFMERVAQGTKLENEEELFLYQQVAKKYPQAYRCVQKISQYLAQTTHYSLTKDEQLYFMLHIQRLAQRATTK